MTTEKPLDKMLQTSQKAALESNGEISFPVRRMDAALETARGSSCSSRKMPYRSLETAKIRPGSLGIGYPRQSSVPKRGPHRRST